jgi:hypothetical protein
MTWKKWIGVIILQVLVLAVIGFSHSFGANTIVDEAEPIDTSEARKRVADMASSLMLKQGYNGPFSFRLEYMKVTDTGVAFLFSKPPTPALFCDLFDSGGCSSIEACNETADLHDVCKDHGGVDETLTEMEPATNGCWGKCADGAIWGILCTNSIVDDPDPVGNHPVPTLNGTPRFEHLQ